MALLRTRRDRNGQLRGAPSGEAHPLARLSAAQVEEIRFWRGLGFGVRPLGALFRVSKQHVSRICRGEHRRAG